MNELIEKVKQLLSAGRHNSAIRELLQAMQAGKGVEKERIKTQLSVLLKHDEVKCAIDDASLQIILNEETMSEEETKPDLYHFTGKAAFPVFNESGCRIAMLNCEQANSQTPMKFDASPEVKGSFLSAIRIVQQFIQENIRASEFNGNDVTVLNWGHLFSFHYNPVKEGIFMTGNKDILEGDSFHFAALASMISFVSKRPVDPGFIFTGAFEGPTAMKVIGKLKEKCEVIKSERPSCQKIVIPDRSNFKGQERAYIEANPAIFLEISGFDDFVIKIFKLKAEELFRFSDDLRHQLGICRIIAHDYGEMDLELYDNIDKEKFNITTQRFRVINCKATPGDRSVMYNVFPLPKIYYRQSGSGVSPTLILINHYAANHNVGNLMFNNGQSHCAFAIGIGAPPTYAMIFAYKFPPNPGLVGKFFSMNGLN